MAVAQRRTVVLKMSKRKRRRGSLGIYRRRRAHAHACVTAHACACVAECVNAFTSISSSILFYPSPNPIEVFRLVALNLRAIRNVTMLVQTYKNMTRESTVIALRLHAHWRYQNQDISWTSDQMFFSRWKYKDLLQSTLRTREPDFGGQILRAKIATMFVEGKFTILS